MTLRSALSAVFLLPLTGFVIAQPLGTAFTYQGQLTEVGQAANGLFDLQVCLFDSPTDPSEIACLPEFDDVPVQTGTFTIVLDFGAAPFAGEQRYLELRVRPGASVDSYVTLTPRQLLRATPEALRANVASAAPWSGLTGVPAGFADAIDNDSGGTVTSVTAGTGLSGGTITDSGIVGIADAGVGLSQIDTTQVQARIAGTCAIGEYFRGVNSDGSVACEPVPGVPRITTVDDPANVVGDYASIAIGTDGLPIIAYRDATASALKVAKCSNAACSAGATITTVDDPANAVGEHVSVAIGADGLPIISYLDTTDAVLKVAKCGNAACTGTATITTVDDPVNGVGYFSSIAVGTDGLPVISYYDFGAAALKIAKCSNPECTGAATITTVDDPVNDVGRYSSIAVGPGNLPVVSYYDFSAGTVKVAKCSDAACSGPTTTITVDDPANVVGDYSSIAIGTDGLPVISYRDLTAGSLKVAKCINEVCIGSVITTVDDPADNAVGQFTSIAIGTDGLPVISYRDTNASALKVARCGNAACTGPATITTVDDPANDVGRSTSIAIGSDGLPVIAYRDLTAGALKVAKCGTRSCQ